MKCPILGFTPHPPFKTIARDWVDCLEAECAWWDLEREMCRLTSLDMRIVLLTEVLLDIRDKMPHAGQFLK